MYARGFVVRKNNSLTVLSATPFVPPTKYHQAQVSIWHVARQASKAAKEPRGKRNDKINIPKTATNSSKLPASMLDARMVSNETMPVFSEKMSDVGVVTFAAGGVQPACSSTDIRLLRTHGLARGKSNE